MSTNYIQVSETRIINVGGGNVTLVEYYPRNTDEASIVIHTVDRQGCLLEGDQAVSAWRYFLAQATPTMRFEET